jgi:hypothetical protein
MWVLPETTLREINSTGSAEFGEGTQTTCHRDLDSRKFPEGIEEECQHLKVCWH